MREKVFVIAAMLAAVLVAATGSADAAGKLSVRVLSDRADLISGGEALTAVSLPRNVKPGSVTVTLNGTPVTSEFAMRPNGSFEALVTGLLPGANVVRAEAPRASSGQVTIVNPAIGGPRIPGPQVKPWVCRNAGATDAQCDAPTTYAYMYKSSVTGSLQPYEPGKPPSDVARTTTDNGQTGPFITPI